MRALRHLCALSGLLAACSGGGSFEFPDLLDPAPFAAQADGRITTPSGLDTLEVGEPVTLSWLGPIGLFEWSLTTPPGSLATLAAATTATPTFTPDVLGDYAIEVSVFPVGAGPETESRRLTAGLAIGTADCARCHIDRAASFSSTAHALTVECEECHGPGSEHHGDPRRIGRTLRGELCGTCHNGSVSADLFTPWKASAHGALPPAGTTSNPSCVRCHTAQGFLSSEAGMPAAEHSAAAAGVSCAVCHLSHGTTNRAQLRLIGSADLASGGSYSAGAAAACFRCHQGEVTDAVAQADALLPFPCAVQGDMIASRGAVEYGRSVGASFHATTVFRLGPFTGNPADSSEPDSCVICHLAEGPSAGLGGHSMRMRQGAATAALGNCDNCHPGLDTFDRAIGADFDGDGVDFGVQTEVQRLTELIFDAIRDADPGGAVSRPGGALTPITLSPDPSKSTTVLRRAVYNYNFVVTDGSSGIHNTTYTVQILQRTYEALTGVPFGSAFPDATLR